MKRQVVNNGFWKLDELEEFTIVYDVLKELRKWTRTQDKEDLRLIIMRGPVAWCSYIGVNLNSPLSGLMYDDPILDEFECHGGLTYAGQGEDEIRPSGWYYFGWDYAHFGDWSLSSSQSEALHKWKFWEIKQDMEIALISMKNLIINLPVATKIPFTTSFNCVKKRMIRLEEKLNG